MLALIVLAAAASAPPPIDARAQPLALDLTVAQRRLIWRRVPKVTASEIELSCFVTREGKPSFCTGPGRAASDDEKLAAYVGAKLVMAAMPVIVDPARLPPSPPARSVLEASRNAQLVLVRVALDPPPPRTIDTETVPLTPATDFALPSSSIDFPPAALREGEGGQVAMRCFVESDRSLDCAIPADQQEVSSPTLERAVLSQMRRRKVGAMLKSGGSAVGKRFQYVISFRID